MARRVPQPKTRSPEQEVNRRAVLDAASRLLVEVGADALSMRRIASEVGTSTMVLYTAFGNKEALIGALMAEGFARFSRELNAVAEADPWENLRELGRAYRRFALQNASYYRLMWSGTSGAGKPSQSPEAIQHGQQAFLALQRAVTEVLARLDRPAKEILPAAFHVWSSVHGFVSLELAGTLKNAGEASAAYESLLLFIARGLGHGAAR